MTIPEQIELAIERHWNVAWTQGRKRLRTDDIEGSAQSAEQELREAIYTALLAAEQRGMERAAEIAEAERQGQIMMKAQAGAQNDRKGHRDHESMAMCAGFIAAAIRKAREERG